MASFLKFVNVAWRQREKNTERRRDREDKVQRDKWRQRELEIQREKYI